MLLASNNGCQGLRPECTASSQIMMPCQSCDWRDQALFADGASSSSIVQQAGGSGSSFPCQQLTALIHIGTVWSVLQQGAVRCTQAASLTLLPTFITAGYSLGKPQQLSQASARVAAHLHVLTVLTVTSCPAASTALHSSTCLGATGQNMKTRFPASRCKEDTQLALPHSQQVQLQLTWLQHWTDSQTLLTEQHTVRLTAVSCSLYQSLSHPCAAAGTVSAVLTEAASEI